MTTLEILLVALLFLLVGYLMGRCGGRVVSQYPKSFIERLKPPSREPMQVYENDPYAEAMEDMPGNKGTIE